MSSAAEGISVNVDSIRAAVAASLSNRTVDPPVESHPPAVPAVEPETPTVAAPLPGEADAQPQTDLPVQGEPESDEFELNLDENPLDGSVAPVAEPVEVQPSKEEWETEFKVLQTTPRGRQILAANREAAKLAAPPEEGGIGFRPDAGEVTEWHRSHSIMDAMMLDFTSGQPSAAEKFVNHWFGKDQNGQMLDGAVEIAEALPQALAKENPEAYQKIGAHFGSAIIGHLQEQAAIPGRSAEDIRRLNDAAVVLSAITGVAVPSNGTPAPAQSNDEVTKLQARIRELETGRAAQTQGQIEATVHRSLEAVIQKDAEAILAPVKKAHEGNPLVFNALKDRLVADMRRMAVGNPAIKAEVLSAITRMVRSGSANQMDPVIRLWRKGYVDHAPQFRTQYLKAAGAGLMQSSDDARNVMRQAQDKTAPSQGAAPTNSQPITVQPRQPNESMNDFTRRLLRERSGQRA